MTTTDEPRLRIGILGTANIARKNARAIHKSRRCELIAIASRRPERATEWAQSVAPWFGPGGVRAYGSYDELLACADIDAVYVPLPTALHATWVRRVADAKKHVLLEKPVALSAAAFLELVQYCRARGVRVMDGTMFVHHPRHASLLTLLDPADAGLGYVVLYIYIYVCA